LRLSVVIPAFNEEALLADSLSSVRLAMKAFDELGWTSELIVCDNNSTDSTASIARAAGALVCVEPVNQIARARNTGAAHATGDWLIFVDADSAPSAALFADVAQAIRAGRCLAGGSTVRFTGRHHWVVTGLAHAWNALSRIARWAPGSFIFCEAAAFREVGGFSQELYAGEEIDLFRRFKRLARRRGRTIVILHQHPLRTSDRKVHLYTFRELLSFLAMTLLSRGRTLRSHRKCFAWYDGRRE
jgi:glycosyltransferase involved in cell wall biosynthesis